MKTSFKHFLFLVLLVSSLSCDREEAITEKDGQVSFVVGAKTAEDGRQSAESTPASLLLTLEDNQGNVVLENKKLDLLQFGQGYVTESLALTVGRYSITKFLVLNSDNKVIHATPLEGSEKAAAVNDPLPLDFTVTANASVEVKPQVLTVTALDKPQSFGYASFGFEVVDAPETMKIKVKVQLRVGNTDYLDVDTKLVVRGFDSLKVEKWKKEFDYVGPADNVLEINAGLDLYTIELRQWGIYDQQIFKREYLWANREDGPQPVTYVLGGAAAPKKISHYISYFTTADPENPGSHTMEPQSKIGYEYDAAGKVTRLTHYRYVKETDSFVPERYAKFNYIAGRVNMILYFQQGATSADLVYGYDYEDNGNVSRIVELKNGVESAAVDFTYNYTDRLINAAYTFSNGQGFQYEFFYKWKNIQTDKTTRGSQLCSEGSYFYDKNINPLKHVGYVDFLLRNYSVNNRLTEDVVYTGCAFPTMIPMVYTYEYDADGYPTVMTTHYKKTPAKSETRYYYN
ncbi:hypothetical protein KK083_09845 [Fulvivirgaceae bacterium PWU4]|uniref:Uncharacterized protein n=1 Tax=Chryseosolibacter histidini TaxID=2782349 RepID=A0AAP2GP89_9BACT|nr:hypothetical protein [Chryseosolibacter histidini]MBT1697177.1 hypothetical protein [Chryseosolibacter histidini]